MKLAVLGAGIDNMIKFQNINNKLCLMTEQPCPHCSQPEIIATPVVDGSKEWALYRLMQGDVVIGAYWGDDVIVTSTSSGWHEVIGVDLYGKRHGIPITDSDFLFHAEKMGWQIYTEPEPETQKDFHYFCCICGKKMNELDSRARVEIYIAGNINAWKEHIPGYSWNNFCPDCYTNIGIEKRVKELKLSKDNVSCDAPKPESATQPSLPISDATQHSKETDLFLYGIAVETQDGKRIDSLKIIIQPNKGETK